MLYEVITPAALELNDSKRKKSLVKDKDKDKDKWKSKKEVNEKDIIYKKKHADEIKKSSVPEKIAITETVSYNFV